MRAKQDLRPGSPAAVLRYYLRNEKAIRAAQAARKGTVGCNHGFRKAARFSTKAELESLRHGEDLVGLQALIFNGAHPRYVNGGGAPRPFRLVNGRLVRVKRVVSH